MRALDTARLVGLVAFLVSGCGTTPPQPSAQCPSLARALGVTYQVQKTMELTGETLSRSLPTHADGFVLYAAHPIAVPLDGDLSLEGRLEIPTRTAPVAFLYGPRDGDGLYGPCAATFEGGPTEHEISFSFAVAPDQGGEYLLVVGTNPLGGAADYTVSVDCKGAGCGGTVCPPRAGTCADEICFNGFITEALDSGVTCPTCQCNQTTCGPGKKLLADRCVCDCAVPASADVVCGVDGLTYASACLATCEGITVAREGTCEAGCPDLSGCALDCPGGLKTVDGCQVCECADGCAQVSKKVAPVCGTDGLSYTNRHQLFCANQGSEPPVTVMGVGRCQPWCLPPKDCALTCPLGYRPKVGVGTSCFKCECMPTPDEAAGTCDSAGLWCARPQSGPFAALGVGPEALGELTGDSSQNPDAVMPQADFVAEVVKHRTFVNRCVAESGIWSPVFGGSCPAGVCNAPEDCGLAQKDLGFTLKVIQVVFQLPEALVADVDCHKPPQSTVPLCSFPIKRICNPALADACPASATCVPVAGTDHGRCEYGCSCLNGLAGSVYDPVCVKGPNGQRTLYNACLATCIGGEVVYPGRCCSNGRLTLAERRDHMVKITAFCKARDKAPRVFLGTACPPTRAQCEEKEALCCNGAD